MRYLVLGVFIFISSFVTASDNTRTQVNYAGVRGDGVIFINLKDSINETGCSQTSIFLGPEVSDVIKNQALSVAMTAYVAQKDVYVQTNDCYDGYPTFKKDSNSSWIHIYNPS